ncbi:hypothetical protein TL16_g05387 [Triparma laevis f. inornata]|uniref:WW domain-containing protein n=1 Tax=Triparma laevis f. inornata TaxID=1714386 RepID=A0A9W7AJ59_9STRA|nr:hypothetical protein TL16_g05387 [Triparma laevis f. inornata]
MMIFGGSLDQQQQNMMSSRAGLDPRQSLSASMATIDEGANPGGPAPGPAYSSPANDKANSKSAEALKRLNQQQVRLAKELERTRRRMKEEVAKVRITTKKLRKTMGHEGESDDDEQQSIDSFAKQLGIDLDSLEDVKKAAGIPPGRRRTTVRDNKNSSNNDNNSVNTDNSKKKKKKKRKAKDGPSTGYSTLPILTTDGRGAFEVNAGLSSNGLPNSGLIPVFALPSVNHRTVEFVNRIPREPKPEEIAARKREKEEMLLMQQHLGLSEADLRDLEEELGMGQGGRTSSNEVDKFLQQQLSRGIGGGSTPQDGAHGVPTLNMDSLGAAGAASVRRKKKSKKSHSIYNFGSAAENEEDEEAAILNRTTPRCLTLGVESTTNELRNELGTSIHSMQALTAAVKEDVIAIQKMCKIGPEHGKAGVYMKSWAVEKVAAILQDMLFSFVGSAFKRWRDVIRLDKKNEKMTKYLKYQGGRKMELFIRDMLKKRLASGWIVWVDAVTEMRRVEREKLENKAAQILQNAWRGRLAKVMVSKIKADRLAKQQHDAAVKIQALARGVATRVNYNKILLERARTHAALCIQCCVRCYFARKVVAAKALAKKKLLATCTLQRYMRGMFGRLETRRRRLERKRNLCAVEIQRCLRGRWGRLKFEKKKRDVLEYSMASIIQKHVRRCLAISRCRRIREENARERRRLEKAAIVVQKYYRGHRGRVMVSLKMKSHTAVNKKRNFAITKIQSWYRGVEARIRVKAMMADKMEYMMNDSRMWQETWSEESNAWFYHNRETEEAKWEPPDCGYTKADGRLVLNTGKVIDDPLKSMTEEEKDAKEKETKCADCEKNEATRLCNECGDKYCTSCYAEAHASGKRAEHTFVRIGPIECEECGMALAVKWCTACDDPFCSDCYDKIHSRGKRRLHAFCNIDSHGAVSPRAWGADGQPAGVFSGGKLGVGGGALDMAEDYGNMETYASDQAGAESFGSVDPSQEWSLYYTDDNLPYWYSNVSGETTYDMPAGAPAAPGMEATTTGYVEEVGVDPPPMEQQEQNSSWLTNAAEEEVEGGGGELPEGWEAFVDDDGNTYYYNAGSGESTYDFPVGGEGGGGGGGDDGYGGGGEGGGGEAASPWEQYFDESGQSYYYNSVTGDSTYENPGI